jgi:hypothetical protein
MLTRNRLWGIVILLGLVGLLSGQAPAAEEEPCPDAISPKEKPIQLFNGTDFTGLYTFHKENGLRKEPGDVFSVKDGMIHVSGEGAGYVATEKCYRDYHLVVEYKWGKKHSNTGIVRNAGVLLHGTGPDRVWMASIECQLAQGCEGDFIVIRGRDAQGERIPVDMATEVRIAEDGKTRWHPGGEKVRYGGKQFWWKDHEPFFKEKLDTRGAKDMASPLGEWTRVECICKGDKVTVKINGVTVNQALDVWPTAGKILLQNEGNEVYYRNFELRPLSE